MSNVNKLREIFDGAIDRTGEERKAFLDGACAGNPELRAQIEALIASGEEGDQFLGSPTAGRLADMQTIVAPPRPSHEAPGTKIGPYKLLQLIGEGGFGSVFLAEQEKPVQRKVALKIIKLGMDTRQVVARFEQERQALAMMEHANIARVLDAGATENGRPFFVMELVKGEPIVEYCDKNGLSINKRLELLAQVCGAVQHAHTKGIIHRDIKPSNILVSTQDGRASVKVIDFGIAKATASKLTEKTLFTEHRQLIGTPEYMSPEQAEGNLDIDTRTDVYSLGVLLYELLTGVTPFSGHELRSVAYAEIQRIIREVEPPKPSTRLSQNTDTIASVAAKRHIEPKRLGTLIRGELDWIVMKALEKDRAQRYETASGLEMDIQRYLAGEAVVAAPPSRAYRFKKFVRRNKGTVTAGVLVGTVLLLGVIGTTWGMVWALQERKAAREAAGAERIAQAEAQERAVALEKVVKFQSAQLSGVDVMQMGIRLRQDLLNGIRQAGERTHATAEMTEASVAAADSGMAKLDFTGIALAALKANIFTPAIDAIHAQFAGQPRVRADLLVNISETVRDLGATDLAERPVVEAVEIRAKELGPSDAKTLEARMIHGLLLKDLGRLDDAEKELSECVGLAVAALGDDAEVTTSLRNNLAAVLFARTRYAEAVAMYRRVLPWFRQHSGPVSLETLSCIASLATALNNLERFDEAEPLFREAVEGFRTVYGVDNPRTINTLNGFAGYYRGRKDYVRARQVFEEALEASRRVRGEDHWLTLMIIDNLGGVHYAAGDPAGAADLARTALDGRRRVLGENHPATLRSCFNLARVLESQNKVDEAAALYRRAVEGFRVAYGEFGPHTITGRSALGGLLIKGGRFKECEELLLSEFGLLDTHPEAPKDRRRNVVLALSKMYQAWDAADQGHASEAAKWKAELDALPAPVKEDKPK